MNYNFYRRLPSKNEEKQLLDIRDNITEYVIKFEELELKKIIGEGSFGKCV